ncbi:MAG: outer membrane lipoprotein-sorting protein [Methanobacterium sp.]
MVRLNAPADLKGTALLSVSKGKSSDQWLYLPSSKHNKYKHANYSHLNHFSLYIN